MSFLLFITWVVIIFVCSDLIGYALRFGLSSVFSGRKPDSERGAHTSQFDAPKDFAHSVFLGFAALWVGLSTAYLLGIATQQLIVSFIGFSALAAAISQRRQIVNWARSRLTFWLLVGAIAVLAAFVTPRFNEIDDPEYLYLIEKLLETGANVEYFNFRRPVTLGGWTFLQAIFSAGPAGTDFVASLDVVIGSILFLLCALLIGAGMWAALPAALCGILVTQAFQLNLGVSISMAAMCAVLIGITLPGTAPRNLFTPITLAIMACTIRPQLGLMAIIVIAFLFWHNRSNSIRPAVAITVGISLIWVLIFFRDTSLLPLSPVPGYNPFLDSAWDSLFSSRSMMKKLKVLWYRDRIKEMYTLVAFAFIVCGWQAMAKRYCVDVRREFLALCAFAVAVIITSYVMIKLDAVLAVQHRRYYVPIAQGFLFVFLIRSGVHGFQQGLYKNRSSFAFLAVMISILCLVNFAPRKFLSAPTESASRICKQLLTPEEQQVFKKVTHGNGYTLLTIACPIGSFTASSRVMMNDLFFMTRGEYYDDTWDTEKTVHWLRKQGVDQLVYLEQDASPAYGLEATRELLEYYETDGQMFRTWEFTFWLKNLEMMRKVGAYCFNERIPIRDPQGPLVVVDLKQCEG